MGLQHRPSNSAVLLRQNGKRYFLTKKKINKCDDELEVLITNIGAKRTQVDVRVASNDDRIRAKQILRILCSV